MSLNYANFIWSVADLLRGSFKAHQYGDIILPFTVLRRLDCVLAPTKDQVLAATALTDGMPVSRGLLKARAGHELSFWNTSRFDLGKLLGDPDNLAANLMAYINAFSAEVKDIFTNYKIEERISELDAADLLLLVTKRFAEVDLSPEAVPNEDMGHIFEELIRKFAEASNETAGEHFTPRDVIELMAELVLTPDDDALNKHHIVRSIYDPAAGEKSTIQHLTAEALRSTQVPFPPPEEQCEIADFLDRETAEIDATIVDARLAIELSRERRAALITAAVTGQIDVSAGGPSRVGGSWEVGDTSDQEAP